jgi:hypothetical protein
MSLPVAGESKTMHILVLAKYGHPLATSFTASRIDVRQQGKSVELFIFESDRRESKQGALHWLFATSSLFK